MDDAIDIFSREKRTAGQEPHEPAEAEVEVTELQRSLEAYLSSLDRTKALETQDEDPDGYIMPRNLDTESLDDVVTLAGKAVSTSIFKEACLAFSRKAPLAEDQRRALNNYLQLGNSEESLLEGAMRPPGLVVREPGENIQTDRLCRQICARKLGFLKEILDPEVVGRIDDLVSFLSTHWRSEAWQEELQNRLEGVWPNCRSGLEFLDAVQRLRKIRIAGSEPEIASLDRQREFNEAKKLFDGTRDPRRLLPESGPISLADVAGAAEAEFQSELFRLRGTVRVTFLREKVALRLAEQEIEKA